MRFGENEKENVNRTLIKNNGSWDNAPIIGEKTVSKPERRRPNEAFTGQASGENRKTNIKNITDLKIGKKILIDT